MNYLLRHTLKNILVILMFCMTVTGASCQRKSEGSGGSVVGNGFIRYSDPVYDYSFLYSQKFTLQKISDAEILLDNSSITENDPRQISNIRFTVINLGTDSDKNLAEIAAKTDNHASWEEIKNRGINGLFSTTKSSSEHYYRYIYRIKSDKILDISANASASADGFKIVEDVLESLSFDTQSPMMHEVYFEPAVIKAGQTAKLRVRAVDNMTQISEKSPGDSVAIGVKNTCRTLMNRNWESIDACGSMRAVGEDWYEFEVPTNSKMRPGSYILYPLTLWDAAGNPSELLPDFDRGVYVSNNRSVQDLIPLATLTVENSSPDDQPPSLVNVRFEPSDITAGEKTYLVFESEDNSSFYTPDKFCQRALDIDWFRFSRTDIPTSAMIDPTEYSVSACSTPTRRKDGSWQVEVRSEIGLPSGDYVTDVSVVDQVGNRSPMQTATLKISSTGPVDLEGPKVLEVKTARKTYRRGESGTILIRATDNLSGIALTTNNPVKNLCAVGLINGTAFSEDNNASRRVPLCNGTFHHIEGDWYGIDFTLTKQLPTGQYTLPSFYVEDNVGNKTFIDIDTTAATPEIYRNKFSKSSLGIPLLKLNVTE